MKEIKINWVDIKTIKPYARNAKKHDEKQVANVAESIKQFGWQQPIVCDKDGVIIIGHCRLLAAKKLKCDKVPVKYATDLTDEQVKKLRNLDNKLNESDWDFDLLAEDIGDLDFSGFDIDWGIVYPDDYGESFELPDGDKSEICQMTFTLHERQAELIKEAIKEVKDNITETFGNQNSNGNALYEVVRQWAEQRK